MIYIVILLCVFLADLLLKLHVERTIKYGEEHPLLNGKLLIRRLDNKGLAFGRLSEHPRMIQWGTLGTLIFTLLYYIWLLLKPGQRFKKAGISMVIGGGLCNWYDRLRQGYVTDYISINSKWKKLKRIVFNISDLFIFMGSVLYLLGSFKRSSGK